MAAAAVADDAYVPETEPPHVDFLRRMAAIDDAYDRGLALDDGADGADVIDFAAARDRRRP